MIPIEEKRKIKFFDQDEIDHFKIIKRVSNGSSATIFHVVDKDTNKNYVLKIIKPPEQDYDYDYDEYYDSNSSLSLDEIRKLITESEIISKLNYPLITQIIGICFNYEFNDQTMAVMVSEYCENGSIQNFIRSKKSDTFSQEMNDTRRLICIYGIASAMKYLHSHQIVHGCLKPSNILLDEFFHPKINDFCPTKKTEFDDLTVPYMAPEVLDKNLFSQQADVYSFGIIVHEILTGKRPDLFKEIELPEKVPNSYRSLISSCLEFDPNQRLTFAEIEKLLRNDKSFISEEINEDEFSQFCDFLDFSQKEKETVFKVNSKPIDLKCFKIEELINKGTFSNVYKVAHTKTSNVFSAKICNKNLDSCDSIRIQNLTREIEILSKLNSNSILRFVGYCENGFENDKKPTIITEFANNFSLEQMIENERKGLSCLNDTKKLIILFGIAFGMSYLHSLNILHRDLKPANIFLNESLYPKIGNFDFSKVEEENNNDDNDFAGTPVYMSPEYLTKTVNHKPSDVYSFSLIAYELLTLRVPFKGFDKIDVLMRVSTGYRPKIQSNVPDCYRELIEDCWSQDPFDRPTFDEIVHYFKTDQSFITNTVNKDEFLRYIDYLIDYSKSESAKVICGGENKDNNLMKPGAKVNDKIMKSVTREKEKTEDNNNAIESDISFASEEMENMKCDQTDDDNKKNKSETEDIENDDKLMVSETSEKDKIEDDNKIKKSRNSKKDKTENDDNTMISETSEKDQIEDENKIKRSRNIKKDKTENDDNITKKPDASDKENDSKLLKSDARGKDKTVDDNKIKTSESNKRDDNKLIKSGTKGNDIENDNKLPKSEARDKDKAENGNNKIKKPEIRDKNKDNKIIKSETREKEKENDDNKLTKHDAREKDKIEVDNKIKKSGNSKKGKEINENKITKPEVRNKENDNELIKPETSKKEKTENDNKLMKSETREKDKTENNKVIKPVISKKDKEDHDNKIMKSETNKNEKIENNNKPIKSETNEKLMKSETKEKDKAENNNKIINPGVNKKDKEENDNKLMKSENNKSQKTENDSKLKKPETKEKDKTENDNKIIKYEINEKIRENKDNKLLKPGSKIKDNENDKIIKPVTSKKEKTVDNNKTVGSDISFASEKRDDVKKEGKILTLEDLESGKTYNSDTRTMEYFESELQSYSEKEVVTTKPKINKTENVSVNVDKLFKLPHSSLETETFGKLEIDDSEEDEESENDVDDSSFSFPQSKMETEGVITRLEIDDDDETDNDDSYNVLESHKYRLNAGLESEGITIKLIVDDSDYDDETENDMSRNAMSYNRKAKKWKKTYRLKKRRRQKKPIKSDESEIPINKPQVKYPIKPRYISLSKSQDTSPIKTQGISPSKQQDKSPIKTQVISPSKPQDKSPSKPQDKSPIITQDKSPIKTQVISPSKPQDKSPIITQDKSPSKPQDKSPIKTQDILPSKQQDKSPSKAQVISPSKPQDKSPSKPPDKSPRKPYDISPSKPPDKSTSKPQDKSFNKSQYTQPIKPLYKQQEISSSAKFNQTIKPTASNNKASIPKNADQTSKPSQSISKSTKKPFVSHYNPKVFYSRFYPSKTPQMPVHDITDNTIKLTVTLKDIGLEGFDAQVPGKAQEIRAHEQKENEIKYSLSQSGTSFVGANSESTLNTSDSKPASLLLSTKKAQKSQAIIPTASPRRDVKRNKSDSNC